MITTIPVHDGPRPAWLDRALALVVVGLGIACTVALLTVRPDARGYDTHTQLGLAPCSWPLLHGIPCPTCGATTAACHLVHGEPIAAVATQPFGALVAASGLWLTAIAAWCLCRGRSFLDVLLQLPRARLFTVGAAVFLLAWLYKYLTFVPGG